MRALPHVVAVIVFIVVSSVFFSPAYKGYDLRQGDIAQFKGMSKEIVDFRDQFGEEPLWTNSMFGGMPAYQISVQQSRNVPKMIQTTVRKLFPGPVGTLFLAMISFYILGLCLRINPWIAIGAALAFGLSSIHILYLGAGHMSKVNAIALMPGVLGGVLLTFRGKLLAGGAVTLLFLSMQLSANHLQMTYYLIFLVGFVVIAELIRLTAGGSIGKGIRSAAVLLVAAILAVLPNMSNILTTYDYSKETTRGKTELTLHPPGQGELLSDRNQDGLDRDYMLEYSMARGEFWSLMIPNIKGGVGGAIGSDRDLLKKVGSDYRENVGQRNRYWGDQLFTGGAFYLGALIMALFLIAFFALNDAIRWPFLILSVLAVMLSWKDTNFIGDFFIEQVPLYAKFRDTKMMLVLVSIMAPTLGMLLLNQLAQKEDKTKMIRLLVGSGVTALVVILFVAAPKVFFEFTSQAENQLFSQYLMGADGKTQTYFKGFLAALEDVRVDILRADGMRSLLFVFIGIAFLLLLKKKAVKPELIFAAFALFVLIDQFAVDRRYLNNEKVGKDFVHWQPKIEKEYPHQHGVAEQFIYEKEISEQTNLLKEINQVVAEKQSESRSKLDLLSRNEREQFSERIKMASQTGVLNLNSNYRVLNIRNPFADARTSYFHKSIGGYHGAKLRRYQEMIEFHLNPELERFVESAQTTGLGVMATLEFANMLNTRYIIVDPNNEPIENPFANGNAWFVEDLEFAATADDEMEAMYTFASKETAIVNDADKGLVPTSVAIDTTATIALKSYLPNFLEYESKSTSEQFAVFSEIYYPSGWQAYIDGEAVEHVRTNYILRGLTVPPGEHSITFKFEPESYSRGQFWASAGSAVFVLLLLGTLVMSLRRSREEAA